MHGLRWHERPCLDGARSGRRSPQAANSPGRDVPAEPSEGGIAGAGTCRDGIGRSAGAGADHLRPVRGTAADAHAAVQTPETRCDPSADGVAARAERRRRMPTSTHQNRSHVSCLPARAWFLKRTVLREKTLPVSWFALSRVFRRMELRGEIRGGRFVAGFSGEQFALPGAIEFSGKLRPAASTLRCGDFGDISRSAQLPGHPDARKARCVLDEAGSAGRVREEFCPRIGTNLQEWKPERKVRRPDFIFGLQLFAKIRADSWTNLSPTRIPMTGNFRLLTFVDAHESPRGECGRGWTAASGIFL